MRVAVAVFAVAFQSMVAFAADDIPWNHVGPYPPEFAAKTGAEWVLNGKATAIDGDSIRFNGVNMRLLGIDAPELGQACLLPGDIPWGCGVAAKVKLEQLIAGQTIRCIGHGTDRYGRNLVVCLSGENWQTRINEAMLLSGMAIVYLPTPNVSKTFHDAERSAKAAKRGMWSGEFVTPSDYRKTKPSL